MDFSPLSRQLVRCCGQFGRRGALMQLNSGGAAILRRQP
jgi:hypothetical protein